MAGRRLRYEAEHLVNGLTVDERLARVEGLLAGDDRKQRPGLVDDLEAMRRTVADLEAASNRARIPWYLRWFVKAEGR